MGICVNRPASTNPATSAATITVGAAMKARPTPPVPWLETIGTTWRTRATGSNATTRAADTAANGSQPSIPVRLMISGPSTKPSAITEA